MRRARVLLVDDHRLVAEGLKSILAAEFDVAGVVEDGRAMLVAAKALRPDVIVSDITMPDLNGIEALEELKKDDPNVRVIFLDHAPRRRVRAARTESGRVRLCAETRGVRGADHGGPRCGSRAAYSSRRCWPRSCWMRRDEDRNRPLTSLRCSRCASARSCGCSPTGFRRSRLERSLGSPHRTVEFHKYRMMESLGAKSGSDLIHFAIKHGIVEA